MSTFLVFNIQNDRAMGFFLLLDRNTRSYTGTFKYICFQDGFDHDLFVIISHCTYCSEFFAEKNYRNLKVSTCCSKYHCWNRQ